MTKVAVVILNWNGKKFLADFLPKVIEYSKDIAEVYVADNASTDDSVSFLKKNFPNVKIIINDENYGFAGGYNKALCNLKEEYFILLNSDIEVTPHWIEPVIEFMDKNKNVAACQPKIRSYYEPDKFEYAGAAGGFIDKYGYPFCRGRIFLSTEIDNGQYDDEKEIFWATGACMFVRADLYKTLGGLDDDFFAHMEEIDLCWRLKNKGFQIYYIPSSTVFHIGGGTLPKSNARKTFLNFRNNFMLLYKNLPASSLYWVFLMRLPLDTVAAFKFLIGGDLKEFIAVSKAHFAFYASLKSLRKKRKAINPQKVSQIYKRCIVISHYLLRKKKFSELNKNSFL